GRDERPAAGARPRRDVVDLVDQGLVVSRLVVAIDLVAALHEVVETVRGELLEIVARAGVVVARFRMGHPDVRLEETEQRDVLPGPVAILRAEGEGIVERREFRAYRRNRVAHP